MILSSEFLKSKPFAVNVADVLQRECIESCLDIPIIKRGNPIQISILKASKYIIYQNSCSQLHQEKGVWS